MQDIAYLAFVEMTAASKSHALPIAAKKVTVFPDVASQSQISEAAG